MTDKAKKLKTAAFNMGKENVKNERIPVDIPAMLKINDFSDVGKVA